MGSEGDRLITPAEAAAIMGYSTATLRRRNAAGEEPLPERRTSAGQRGHRRYRLSRVQAAAKAAEEAARESGATSG